MGGRGAEGGNKGPGWKSQRQLSEEFSQDRPGGWNQARHKMPCLALDSRPGIGDRATRKAGAGCPTRGCPAKGAQAPGWGSAQRKGHLF